MAALPVDPLEQWPTLWDKSAGNVGTGVNRATAIAAYVDDQSLDVGLLEGVDRRAERAEGIRGGEVADMEVTDPTIQDAVRQPVDSDLGAKQG